LLQGTKGTCFPKEFKPICDGEPCFLGELGHIPQATIYPPGTWPIFPWQPLFPKELGSIALGEAIANPLVLRGKGGNLVKSPSHQEVVRCPGITSFFSFIHGKNDKLKKNPNLDH
jgi:hypothetical protein